MGLKSGEVQKLFEGIENKSEGIEGKKQENVNRAKEFAENNQIPESPEEFKKFQDSLRPISDANGTLAAKTREIKFNLKENNTTEITNFKKQFEEVLSNQNFADGDIPETLQREMEINDEIAELENHIKQLKKDIDYLDINDPKDMGLIASLTSKKESLETELGFLENEKNQNYEMPIE